MILHDGTVIPSYFGVESMGVASAGQNTFLNQSLRLGEVREIHYPGDKKNLSGKVVEYEVAVQQQEGSGPAATVTYPNCIAVNLFGGVADKLRYTYRKATNPVASKATVSNGAKVLVLCVNGSSRRAYIVGGVTEIPDKDDLEKKDDGHNLAFEFNGIGFGIDREGQAKLTFRGATKIDGSLDESAGADEANGPTTVELLKNGNFTLYTKDSKQSLTLDHENKKAAFVFDEAWEVSVAGRVQERYGEDWTLESGGATSIKSTGSVAIESSTSTWTARSAGQSFIKSAGLQVGMATDAMMKGTTYRVAETALHSQLLAALGTLAGVLGSAGGSMSAAAVPMAIPIIGPVVAAPMLGAVGAQLTACIGIIGQMVAAISSFEAQAPTFLSLVNKND
jgi:hypothetical protein